MWNLKTPVQGVPLRYILVALGLLAGLLYLYFGERAPDIFKRKAGPVTIAEEAKEARWVEPEWVKGPEKIRTYPKITLAGKLKMPELANLSGDVLATATIPPHAGPTTAIAKMDNGVTQVIYRQEKTPFFQIKKEFGVRMGMGTGGLILGEIYARPLRVGNVEFEARAFAKRDDKSGADFGAAILIDWRF